MIDKNELEEYAKFIGIDSWKQEIHYIQSIILYSLAEQPIVFKGGTYLWFFLGLNRFSEDLDFTANGILSSDIEAKVVKGLNYFGIKSEIKDKIISKREYSFKVESEGPLYDFSHQKCSVYVEISKREEIILQNKQFLFSNDVYKLPEKMIYGMNTDELSSEKVRAILKRNKPRDIYDLNFLIKKHNVKFDLDLVNKKLSYYKKSFDLEEFKKKIDLLEKDYNKEMNILIAGKIEDYDILKNNIINWIEK